ncbi:MAG TPA: galactokinase family protein [Nocardioides sp.]|nr:galactokinase family protein [Nocardioides sp.]
MSTARAVAPGRVNLIGEHTDYNRGLCLPFAIPLATTAAVTARTDRVLEIASDRGEPWTGTLDDVAARSVTGWPSYVAGVVWALQELGWALPGLEISLSSTIPLGGGLSSSAALECSVAVAVAGLLGRPLGRRARLELAEACRRAETEYVGAPTGGVDQLASLLATEGHGVLVDFADPTAPRATNVPLDLAAAGLAVLVVDTGVRHSLADGDGGYAQRRAEAEAGEPRRLRHVRTENARVRETIAAVGTGDWAGVGALLTASHLSLRDDYEVSCRELDVTVDAALAAGALGARLTGGGFGGCAIALVRAADDARVRASVDASYAEQGWPAPRHHTVQPSAGARLV